MPILINSTTFTDIFGNTLPALRANAGDKVTVAMEIDSSIRVQSGSGVYLTLDPISNIINWSGGDWLEEGFRVGDTVQFVIYSSGGSPVHTWVTAVTYVDATSLDVGAVPHWIASGEIVAVYVVGRNRADLDLRLNQVKNGQPGTDASLLDGETTRFFFSDLNSLAVSGVQSGVAIPNQSGQYVESASIRRAADPNLWTRRFNLEFDVVLSGLYDETLYNVADCLKQYVRFSWSSLVSEVDNLTYKVFNDDANTGWFDQGHNISLFDSSLVQGVNELDYCVTTNHEVIVDGPVTELAIGGAYISLDETYYKNQLPSQLNVSMVLPSSDANAPATYDSFQNDSGAGFRITINTVTTVGSQTTINFDFTPNTAFQSFMDGREDGDRLFYLWVKCGNVNHLAYQDQLVCDAQTEFPLTMESSFAFVDHAVNTDVITGSDSTTDNFDTEDDLAYYGTFLLDKEALFDSFQCRVEAYDAVNDDDFTLFSISFDFSGVPISGDGRYLLNETTGVISTLPATSLKLNAILKLEPSIDTATQYGVSIYFPVLLRWEYWLSQTNASVDFWPNQNKNWEQYDNISPWKVRTKLRLIQGDIAFVHSDIVSINPYDNEVNIDSDLQLIRESDGAIVSAVIDGEMMRIKSTHTNLTGAWDQSNIWGMITVEPKESSRRWICSTVVPFDNDVTNPLTPESGLLIVISYPSPDVAVMECLFDTTKIDISNGVSITGKIKGCTTDLPLTIAKATTADEDKFTTSDEQKETA